MLVVTGTQVFGHLLGDFAFQADEVATGKTAKTWMALFHVALYGLVFWLVVRPSWMALAVVVGSHFVIDRWRLARHVGWLKNWLSPSGLRWLGWSLAWRLSGGGTVPLPSPVAPWSECSGTGYSKEKPAYMAVWLMITVDQLLHVACNAAAMQYWPR